MALRKPRERPGLVSAISRAFERGTAAPKASGDATKRRLIEAAQRLFAERGYAAVTVRDITRSAGANLSAVNYHFHGKLGLYEAVRRRSAGAGDSPSGPG